jgi:hypothetical protein
VGRCLIFFPLLKIKLQLLRQHGIRLTIQLVSSSILWMRSAAFSLGRVTSLVAETDVGSAAETGGGEAPARCRTVRHGRACESAEMAAARAEKNMHQPGIEPGSVPWQGTILPLDHWCSSGNLEVVFYTFTCTILFVLCPAS